MRFLFSFHGLLVLLGLIAACSAVTTRSPDQIGFSHHVHTEQELECAECHGALLADANRAVQGIPGKAECAACHDVEDKQACATCHSNAQQPSTWVRGRDNYIRFSHQAHTGREAHCEACHQGAAHWPSLAGTPQPKPGHDICVSCHKKDLDGGDCRMCHDRLDTYPERPTAVIPHKPGFFARHRVEALASEDTCAQCHRQSFCTDCHGGNMTVRPSLRTPERVDREFMHSGDWLSRHGMEVRVVDTGCLKCHNTSFCSSCHR